MTRLTHLDDSGAARMVDVGGKRETARSATAAGRIRMAPATLAAVREGSGPKGDVLAAARIAGIMAAKKTAELIPLCHPIPLTGVDLTLERSGRGIRVVASVRTAGRTGVEMEAMTAVAVAALTIYDMVKGVERGVTIEAVELMMKSGGRSGTWKRD